MEIVSSWPDSGYILKTEPEGFPNRLYKEDSKIFVLSNGKTSYLLSLRKGPGFNFLCMFLSSKYSLE